MKIVDLDKTFLQKINTIFNESKYGNITYDNLGFLFSDYFMDTLAEIHRNNSMEKFLSITEIYSNEDNIICNTNR